MVDRSANSAGLINSIVGEGTVFKGDIDLNGLLRIDGDYTGVISTSGKVVVGVNGRVESSIQAGTVVIGGVIKGNIAATEKVIILSSGIFIGNIITPRLVADEGVILNGRCLVGVEQKEFPREIKNNPANKEPSLNPERIFKAQPR